MTQPRPWTDDDDARLVDLVMVQHLSCVIAGERLNRGPKAVSRRLIIIVLGEDTP